ncbi:MAG TPA: carboxypeptidase-like regulatory domain-containing protein [Pyrinomonadaceae bacterium]
MRGFTTPPPSTSHGRAARLAAASVLTVTLLLLTCAHGSLAAQAGGAVAGRVTDPAGAVVVGAGLVLRGAAGAERRATSDAEGRYAFGGLAPGAYALRVEARGFQTLEAAGVRVVAGGRSEFDVRLAVALERQEVTVGDESAVGVEPGENRSALRFGETDLDALPEDPDDLAAALQSLAGAAAGPSGGQILVDGFENTGEPLPPRGSIREVRVNQNPFSAENDRLGFGQIQIFTRAGTEKLRGQVFFNFNDESLNARNPFTPARAAYRMRNAGGGLSGTLAPRRASFFLWLEERATDDNALVNAVVLDESLAPRTLAFTARFPRSQLSANARLDLQLGEAHTLGVRYNYYRHRSENGVGGVSLPERGFAFTLPINTFQLTETAVLGPRLLNEFRFQYVGEDQVEEPFSALPALNVSGAFLSGGSPSGRARNPEGRLTAQDSLLWTAGAHTLRAGARLRRTTITDGSPDDFNGTYTFAGGLAPRLDAAGDPVRDASGQVIMIPVTSIERYRRTLLFSAPNCGTSAGRFPCLSPAEVRARGGGATQLTLGGGDPLAEATQVDFGAYFQGDWRVRPNLTASYGLRYEFQTNIGVRLNLAPRVALAWSPGLKAGDPASKAVTVVRAGFGVFFDRFNENQVLIANKYAAGDFFRFVVDDAGLLDSFPAVPSIDTLRAAASANQTTFRIAEDLREPYMMQAAVGVERQLPRRSTLAVTYVASRTLHALRARNVNAPVVVGDTSGEVVTRARPRPEAGNVIQYESSGRLNQHQLLVTLNARPSGRASFFANYTLGRARGDTEGAGTFPADAYDLRGEYGRSSSDARHTFAAGGTFEAAWGLRLSPLVYASAGRPFNITSGVDSNGDAFFADRPAHASDLTRPTVRVTPFGAFDTEPPPGQPVIPRNYGEGPGYFVVNLGVSRTFAFGRAAAGRGGGGGQAGAGGEGRFRLTPGLRFTNLFNRVNLGAPVGNLGSPLFGRSVATAGGFGAGSVGNPAAGNRRVEAQIRLEF